MRRFPVRVVALDVLALCTGTVRAALLLRRLLGNTADIGATVPAVDPGRAFVVEAGYTALLGLVIMAVATDERCAGISVPLVLGVTVAAGAIVTGPRTGGSFNPACSLGPAVASGVWTAHRLYWVEPATGMAGRRQFSEMSRDVSAPRAQRIEPTGVEGPLRAHDTSAGSRSTAVIA